MGHNLALYFHLPFLRVKQLISGKLEIIPIF